MRNSLAVAEWQIILTQSWAIACRFLLPKLTIDYLCCADGQETSVLHLRLSQECSSRTPCSVFCSRATLKSRFSEPEL